MDDKQRGEIKEIISIEIAKTTTTIEEYEEMTKPIAPENSIGRISRMDAINNKAVNDRALSKDLERKAALENVLDNFDKPGFGLCSRCSNPIPPLRLVYVPETRVCIDCAGR